MTLLILDDIQVAWLKTYVYWLQSLGGDGQEQGAILQWPGSRRLFPPFFIGLTIDVNVNTHAGVKLVIQNVQPGALGFPMVCRLVVTFVMHIVYDNADTRKHFLLFGM